MKKKKVLFVLATSKFSGAENVAITIIENMNKNYDMAYASLNGDIKKNLEHKKIDFIPMKKLSLKEVKRIIEKFNPDIIHANDYRTSFLCSIAKGDRVLISHLHNNVPWLSKRCMNSFIFLYFAKKSYKVLTVSESIKKEFIYSDRISDKFVCIDNPVSCSKIINMVDGKDKNKKYDICCVARVTKQKNPLRFLKVIEAVKEKYPNIKAIWVGDFNKEDQYTKEVFEYTKEKSLENNVEFIGFKDNPYEYMNMSKVFLLTSDWEGYGLVAFEALSLGLPCVVSNVGGLVNIVNETCGKLCDIKKIYDYSDELCELLTSDKYYSMKSKKAISRSRQLDNIESYCEKLNELYINC